MAELEELGDEVGVEGDREEFADEGGGVECALLLGGEAGEGVGDGVDAGAGGVEEGDGEGGEEPGPGAAEALKGGVAAGGQEIGGFKKEVGGDAGEADDEAGMEVDPEEDEEGKWPEAAGEAALEVPEEREDEGEEDGVEGVCAGGGAEGDGFDGAEGEGDGGEGGAAKEDGDGGEAGEGGEPTEAGGAEERIDEGEEDAGEGWVEPGAAVGGVGENVGGRDGVVLEDPAAGGDVPAHISVGYGAEAGGEGVGEDEEDEDEQGEAIWGEGEAGCGWGFVALHDGARVSKRVGSGGRQGLGGVGEAVAADELLDEEVEDFGPDVGDGFAGACAGFAPGKEEEEGNPASGVAFNECADAAEGAGHVEGEEDGLGLQAGWVGAVGGVRGDEILAADEGADGVDGAGFVFEEGAGDALVEVVESELAGAVGVGEPVAVDHAVNEAGGGELAEGLVEAGGEGLLAIFGEGGDPVGERFSLKDAEGDHLAAACAAAGAAGDGAAVGLDVGDDLGEESIFKGVEDGEELSEIGGAGGDFGSHGEWFAVDGEGEIDADRLGGGSGHGEHYRGERGRWAREGACGQGWG